MRTLLKHTLETALSRSGLPRAARRQRRGDTLVLAYHNVVPHGCSYDGDLSLHLSQRAFASQLDLLLRTHDVIPLADIFSAPGGRRPRAVITFDDAYRGAVTVGADELARRGLPATIFVTPAFLGGGAFWWDLLAEPDTGGLLPQLREDCLSRLQGRHQAILEWAAKLRIPVRKAVPHQTGATEDELRHAVARGLTLGAHTWSHPNLTALETPALVHELAEPLRWLRERFDAVLPWVSYPYGLSSPDVEAAAAAAGYQGAFRVEGGWMPRDSFQRPHALPRLNIPSGVSQRRFELNTSGVLFR